jgi:hypothetical protein
MIVKAFRNGLDQFLGRGNASVTVPPMDGALKPNSRLDDALCVAQVAEPDNLAVLNGAPIFSSGNVVYRFDHQTGAATPLQTVEGNVSALAVSTGQALAIAADRGGITLLGGKHDGRSFAKAGDQALSCVTAIAFLNEDTLLLCLGSAANPLSSWQRDLLEHGQSGSVWRLDLVAGQASRLIGNLAFPNGILVQADGQHVVISESWQKRLLRLNLQGGRPEQLIEDLPGYPARIANAGGGGAWLSVFAPRSQLIEFILRERTYRRTMMAEVAPEYWIAPALRSGVSFREPMQGGALKQMGILKPWAPTRSYGLVIELNSAFEPVRSLHSRAAGRRHGITTCIEYGSELWMTSKGGDEVVKVNLAAQGA